ncbi:FAD/NAD(P)-binding protein [Nocardia sp. NPDC101769]|uniref:FAD/NAD(P)-binding protein n=1 Tax=Nocardia sp. NPDC101769 TaxID=3364333 RepID=UPI003830781B
MSHPWTETASWRVTGTRRESADTFTLELEPPQGHTFVFRPGQFNMLGAFGTGEVPISISGDPAACGPVLHTVRDVGMATRALCALQPGDRVGLRGPYGTGWPLQEAEGADVLVIAGGIGLPPLRSAMYHILAHRDRYQRVALLYGARTPTDLLFTDELDRWRSQFDIDVRVTVDAAAGDWRGEVGVVPDLIATTRFQPATATAFMVGPEIMMRFTVRTLESAGVPADRIFLSMERNMQCAVALCGHCQFGPFLICRDGPVLCYRVLAQWLRLREV